MKPEIFNALVWLNRPVIRIAIVVLAFLLVATYAKAVELIVVDDPKCTYCIQFNDEVVPTYGQSSNAEWILLHPVVYSVGYVQTPEKWPDWFRDALNDGRIAPITGTPTFIFYETPMGDPMPREIGRIVGYGGKDWFHNQLNHYHTAYDKWLLTH